MEKSEEPNLGKLIDQNLEAFLWNRDNNNEIDSINLVFKSHSLIVTVHKDKLILRLVEI